MRCHICNDDNAEHRDKRDDTYLCANCKDDIDGITYDWHETLVRERKHEYKPEAKS